MIRVLLVDDEAMIREALRDYISADPTLQVVGVAADGAESRENCVADDPSAWFVIDTTAAASPAGSSVLQEADPPEVVTGDSPS